MQFELVRPVYNLKRTSLIIQKLQTECKSFKTTVLQLVQTIDFTDLNSIARRLCMRIAG